MSTIDKPHVSLGTLRRHLRGVPVIGPGEEGWDPARQAFNTTVDQRPALIATPLDADDVAAVVRYAADAGLQIAPQRTGHNAAPLGDLGDSILLKTDQLQGVKIDVENRTRPRALRRQVGEGRPARLRPRPRRAARLDAGRQRRRLLARRRPRLVRPQARPRREQRHRDRARHRRRRAAPRRRASTSPSSSGRCAAAAATSAS